MIKQPNYFVTEVVLINYIFTGGRKKAALLFLIIGGFGLQDTSKTNLREQ